MSVFQSRAFCPQCKKEAIFTRAEGTGFCASCGFQYPLHSGSLPGDEGIVDRSFWVTCTRIIVILALVLFLGAAVFLLVLA